MFDHTYAFIHVIEVHTYLGKVCCLMFMTGILVNIPLYNDLSLNDIMHDKRYFILRYRVMD